MEFLNGGSLHRHLNRQTVFTEKQAIFYSAQILCGLSYLHSKEIIHR
jgi:serine/threonine protein kinase